MHHVTQVLNEKFIRECSALGAWSVATPFSDKNSQSMSSLGLGSSQFGLEFGSDDAGENERGIHDEIAQQVYADLIVEMAMQEAFGQEAAELEAMEIVMQNDNAL